MSHEVKDFGQEVLQRSRQVPVLADFWAPWCAPCRTLGPVLEKLAAESGGRWELAKVNTEEHQNAAAQFEVASIPAVKLFIDGEVRNEFVGALTEREVRQFLKESLPSPQVAQIAEAKDRIDHGDPAGALALLGPVLESEPDNDEARLLAALALLTTAPEKIPGMLDPVGPDSDFADKAAAMRTLSRIAQVPAHAGDLAEAKVKNRYLEGAEAVKRGNFEGALEAFIEVLERNKTYDDGGAREVCKAIFQLFGMHHAWTERFVRPFSSALHS